MPAIPEEGGKTCRRRARSAAVGLPHSTLPSPKVSDDAVSAGVAKEESCPCPEGMMPSELPRTVPLRGRERRKEDAGRC